MVTALAHPRRRGGRAAGFTLIDTMVVLALLAILAALAGPAMSEFVTRQRVRTSASNLHLALMKARAEAIKRNTTVSVQPISGTDWSSGWNVMVGVTVLDVTAPTGSVVVAPTPTGTAVVRYRADGRTSTGSVQFGLTSARSKSARCVAIDPAGRPYVKEGSTCA